MRTHNKACTLLQLRMNKVMLQTDELNLRSHRALERSGGKLEGVQPQDKVSWDGRWRSSAIYSILRSEWLAKR
jgi:N-acetyltransferase